jgi:hypothetical protein
VSAVFQYSEQLRNSQLNVIAALIGPRAVLQIFSGPRPASCADKDTGTLLVEIALPAKWMQRASGGRAEQAGQWSGPVLATGDARHFRIKDSDKVTHVQGMVTTGGTGALVFADTHFNRGEQVTIDAFACVAGNE